MHRRVPSLRRRLAALWLLGVLVGSLGWTAPLLALSAAALDSDHTVRLQPAVHGTRLVLVHDRDPGAAAEVHRHGQVASMLVVFSQPAGPDHADHVLEFGPGSGTAPAASAVTVRPQPPQPGPAVTWVPEASRPAFRLQVPDESPADRVPDSDRIGRMRTVVLRI